MGYDAAENYMFLEIHNLCVWIVIWGSSQESFYIFLTGKRLSNLIPDNVMGLKILKRKCACGSSFVKIIRKLLSLKMSIYYIKSRMNIVPTIMNLYHI